MFNKANNFNSQICSWNLDGKATTEMFTGSLCSVLSCITCATSPCLNSLVLNDKTAKKKLSDNSVNKEVIRCFDTSKVTNMKQLFQDTGINADLSSWDVSSVTTMDVSYQSSQYLLYYQIQYYYVYFIDV